MNVITISVLYFNTVHVKLILDIIYSFEITSARGGRFIDEMCRRVHVMYTCWCMYVCDCTLQFTGSKCRETSATKRQKENCYKWVNNLRRKCRRSVFFARQEINLYVWSKRISRFKAFQMQSTATHHTETLPTSAPSYSYSQKRKLSSSVNEFPGALSCPSPNPPGSIIKSISFHRTTWLLWNVSETASERGIVCRRDNKPSFL